MTIKEVVDRAIKKGCLSHQLEMALLRAIEYNFVHTPEDLQALAKLQACVKSGKVVTHERKRCFNIMEDLVWEVLEKEYATLRIKEALLPDAGEVVAYALNHLKPLYATSQKGAEYQRKKAQPELMDLVRKRVRESLEHSMGHPVWEPNSEPIAKPASKKSMGDFLGNVLRRPQK